MKKIISVIGARPQFIKHAPMQIALGKKFIAKTIHTGQHYDLNMSDIFFNELQISSPDFVFSLEGTHLHGEQTGVMMRDIEKVCTLEKPDALLVYGDTNSTLAGAIVAAKAGIPLIHIEAGLRSFNRAMPEEINRIIADQLASILFCPTTTAIENLKKEGISHERIFLSGDVMCDLLEMVRPKMKRMVEGDYYFATLHRPYNTDDLGRLIQILETFNKLDNPVVFPAHPRTTQRLKTAGVNILQFSNIRFIAPLGYLDSISHQAFSNCVITDSGGMQKEAYMLRKKCVTIRSETEWTETLAGGWNTLVFENLGDLQNKIYEKPGEYREYLYGNGKASADITSKIEAAL